jgi:hypothetical protein
MTEDDKYNVIDLVSNARDQKPTEFEDTFNSLITDKIRSAIETRKQEIATSMFNHEVNQTEEE